MKRILVLAFVSGAVGASPALAAAPVARVSAPRTSCIAPCAIFFDARATTDADFAEPFRNFTDLVYTWDFGDPSSGFWRQGARAGTADPHPKNADSGPVAGHVYEQVGTYTVQLRVSDGTSSSSASLVINVSDPGARWPGTATKCIAATATPVAGQGGCPAGAAVLRTADFDSAMAGLTCDRSSVRCLFRRGDTFTADRSTGMTSAGPTLIGAYGAGAKPRITSTAGVDVLRFDQGSHDIRVADLQLVGPDGSGSASGSALALGYAPGATGPGTGAQPRRILALRLDISHFDYQVYFHGPNAIYTPGVNIPSEIAIVDSTVLDGPGLGGNDVYVMWEKSLLLGNRAGDKFDGLGTGQGEHVVRAKFSHGAVYAHNSLGLLNDADGRIGCGDLRAVMKIVSGLANDYFPAGVSREFVVADNYVSACKRNSWDVDLGRTDATQQKLYEGQQAFVVERNLFSKRFNTNASHLSLQVEGEWGAVRGNAFDLSGSTQTSTPRAVRVWNRAPVPDPPVPTHGVRVDNNACYENATTAGGGVCIDVQSMARDTLVRNNVLFDAGSGRPRGPATLLADSGFATTTCSGCNMTVTSSPFVSLDPRTLLDFVPASPGPLVDAGQTIAWTPVNFDALGGATIRDGDGDGAARSDVGAFEARGGPGDAPGEVPAAPILLP